MPIPELGAQVAGHLADAATAFKRGSDALRVAAKLSQGKPIAGLDTDALGTFAAVADANRAGVERMEASVRRQFPEDTSLGTSRVVVAR